MLMMNSEETAPMPNSKYTPAEESEFLKTAVAHINIHVFVYDIPLHKLYFFESTTYPLGVLKGSEHSVQDIIDLDIIEKGTVPLFQSLFQKIEQGEKSADAIIKTCNGSTSAWHHIMINNHFDKNGKPIRAVGTIQDVSYRIEIEQLYSNEKQFRFAMLADSRRVYEINVTRDRFIRLESIQDTTDYGEWDTYTQAMADLCKTRVYRKDWDTFLKVATKENLVQGFESGITEFHCEYRIIDDDGQTAWSSSTTHLLRDPDTDDIKGFIYVKDIDKQKETELNLCRQAELDPLTEIYNRRTAERLITQIILTAKSTQIYGFLLFDIDEFKYVNDNYGHQKGDFLLQQIACEIKKTLRDDDIFARMGGDEFVVFLNHMNTIDEITNIADRICQCVKSICVDEGNDFHATISVGIAAYPSHGGTFAELYKNSDYSLYEVKHRGKNGISLFGTQSNR